MVRSLFYLYENKAGMKYGIMTSVGFQAQNYFTKTLKTQLQSDQSVSDFPFREREPVIMQKLTIVLRGKNTCFLAIAI